MGQLLNYKFIIFGLFLFFNGEICFSQERSLFGKIINSETGLPLESVNVTNKRSGQIGVSNDKGVFFLRALSGDSILVTSIGYKKVGIKWDGISKEPTIELSNDAILLSEVIIKQKRLSLLKSEVDNLLYNPENAESMLKEARGKIINTDVTPGSGVGISIDALYDIFSKEGKMNRKVAELKYQEKLKYYASLRFNEEVASRVAHINPEELTEFVNYCKLDEKFVLRATDYELNYSILQCKKKFNTSKIFNYKN